MFDTPEEWVEAYNKIDKEMCYIWFTFPSLEINKQAVKAFFSKIGSSEE